MEQKDIKTTRCKKKSHEICKNDTKYAKLTGNNDKRQNDAVNHKKRKKMSSEFI